MDSEWALLEFRPGRYVKVTATGEVLGRPTDEEIRAWFASRGWGVDSTPESLSLDLDPQTETAEDAPQTVTFHQPTQTHVPGDALRTTEVVPNAPLPAPTPTSHSVRDALSLSAEQVPMILVPELDVPTEVVPTDPPDDIQGGDADAEKEQAAYEPVDAGSAVESQGNEPSRAEPVAQRAGTGRALEASTTKPEPPSAQAVVPSDDVGEIVSKPARELPITVRPSAAASGEAEPGRRDSQEAWPEMPESRAAPEADEAPEVDGTGRWLWVDPRQEGGYGQGSHDLASFLSRAVQLFVSKPWARGENPSRLAVHPDHITKELELVAEAQGLEVLGDAHVMAGTYMLGLGDRASDD